jgi:hypothetical protein
MSLVMKLAVGALSTLAAVACASTPKEIATPAPPAARTPSAEPTNAAASSAERATGAEVNAKLVGQGYKPVKVKDAFVYCRMEAMTGTQFKKRVCLTEAAIHDLEEQTKQTQESMTRQRTGPACFTKTC